MVERSRLFWVDVVVSCRDLLHRILLERQCIDALYSVHPVCCRHACHFCNFSQPPGFTNGSIRGSIDGSVISEIREARDGTVVAATSAFCSPVWFSPLIRANNASGFADSPVPRQSNPALAAGKTLAQGALREKGLSLSVHALLRIASGRLVEYTGFHTIGREVQQRIGSE